MKLIPEISIITVNYNGLQETKDLIESLQLYLHSCSYEIIVVDNGSEKNEAILLKQIYPAIQIVRSEHNLGFAAGNNLGIKIARGEYIFLLNNDTFIKDDSLHFLKKRLVNQPGIGAVSPKIKFAFEPQNIQFAGFTPMSKYTLRNQIIGYNKPEETCYNVAGPTPFLHGAAMMIKREVIEKTGLMPETYFLYYEEMDWCDQIRKQGYELWYEPLCTIFHKESSSTGRESPLKTYYLTRNRLLYAWRNRQGISRIIALFYQLLLAIPKNIIVNLLTGRKSQMKATFKGCANFFILKNKML